MLYLLSTKFPLSFHQVSTKFPRIPNKLAKCSQRGNGLFPRWEYSVPTLGMRIEAGGSG